MKRLFVTLATTAGMVLATPALAASDYLLKLDGVKGEAAATIEISSWSWGTSNPSASENHEVKSPRDAASGLATGKRQHEPIIIVHGSAAQAAAGSGAAAASYAATGRMGAGKASMSDLSVMREGAAAGVNVAVGDVNGDGLVDFADTDNASEVSQFTLQFDKSSPELATKCVKGTHFPTAIITARGTSYVLEDAVVTGCITGQPQIVDNKRTGDQMPNRISMNVTTPKQTQGATFGEKVNQGLQAAGSALAQGAMRMTLTGQLKHTKTGHVTILK